MAGPRPLTEEEKELLSLYGKPVTVYHFLRAFSRDKPRILPRCLRYRIQARKKMANSGGFSIFNYMNCDNIILRYEVVKKNYCPFCPMNCGSLVGVKHHLTSSHDLFDFNFRLSEHGHRNFDVSVKPDAFENGVLNYDLEAYHLDDYTFYRLKSRMRGQVHCPKGRRFCEIFEKYSDDVPRDEPNELPHENGNISSSPARTPLSEETSVPRDNANELPRENGNISSSSARTRLSEETSDIQTITQPERGQRSNAKRPRATVRKKLNPKPNPKRVQAERTVPLTSRQFYHSRTLQPMTLEEVMSDADSDDEDDEDFNDLLERMKLDRLVDASDEEKRFMWLWNTFIRKQRVYVDKHIPWACEEFIKVHAKELIARKLVWQWRMFAIDTLCIKYGLISAKTMDKCSIILQYAQEGKEPPEEVVPAAEVAAEEAEAAAAAAAAKKAAAAAKKAADAVAAAAASTRKSARIQKKKARCSSHL